MNLRQRITDNAIRILRFAAEQPFSMLPDGAFDLLTRACAVENRLKTAVDEVVRCCGTGVLHLQQYVDDEIFEALTAVESSQDALGPVTELSSLLQRFEMVNSLSHCIEGITSGDAMQEVLALETLRSVQSETRNVNVDTSDTGAICPEMSRAMTADMLAEISRDRLIPTGTVFDTWSILGPGELGIVLSQPGVGKTTALVDIGAGYITNNEGLVMHFSEEMSRASVMAKYVERTFCGDMPHLLGSAIIESHPTGTMSVNQLCVRIDHLLSTQDAYRKNGSRLPLLAIICDYLALLRSEVDAPRYEQLSRIAVDLRGMGGRYSCPVWSACQPQRNPAREVSLTLPQHGRRLPVLGMQDVAECWAIPHVTDYMLSLNQTDQERNENPCKIRIHMAKARFPRKDAVHETTIGARVWYDRCTFQTS